MEEEYDATTKNIKLILGHCRGNLKNPVLSNKHVYLFLLYYCFFSITYTTIIKLYKVYPVDIFFERNLNNLQHLVKSNQSLNYIANFLKRGEYISAYQETIWVNKNI